MANKHLTAIEVSEALGVSVPTIWRWAREGVLPAPVKLGPKVSRWPSDEIAAHIEGAKAARKEGTS